MARVAHHRRGPRKSRDTSSSLDRSGLNPPVRVREKPPEPLPVCLNTCRQCGHNNVAIGRVEKCALCDTKIPAQWYWTTPDFAQFKKRKATTDATPT
jgi:hypothetical protein